MLPDNEIWLHLKYTKYIENHSYEDNLNPSKLKEHIMTFLSISWPFLTAVREPPCDAGAAGSAALSDSQGLRPGCTWDSQRGKWYFLKQLPAFTGYLFRRFSYLTVIWLNFKQKLSWKGASHCVSQYLALAAPTVSTNALRKTLVQP